MIIRCINCNKTFSVNSDLIPKEGRTIQCGSCNHIWFFKKNHNVPNDDEISETKIVKEDNLSEIKVVKKEKLPKKKHSEIVKYQPKRKFTFGRFLSYIIVSLISFIGFIIVLDTFKTPLYSAYPDLELIIYNFFETLKDIELFIKDLIKYD